jgi:hypothetical protein
MLRSALCFELSGTVQVYLWMWLGAILMHFELGIAVEYWHLESALYFVCCLGLNIPRACYAE